MSPGAMRSQPILAKAFHAVAQVNPSPLRIKSLSTYQLRVPVEIPAGVPDEPCACAPAFMNIGAKLTPLPTRAGCRPKAASNFRLSMSMRFTVVPNEPQWTICQAPVFMPAPI